MAFDLPKPSPGDPIRAADFGRMSEAIHRLQGGSPTERRGPGRESKTPTGTRNAIARAVNRSAVFTILPGQPVALTGQALGQERPDAELLVEIAEFGNQSIADRFAIALDPIPPGRLGRVVIAGVAWAQGNGAGGDYASPSAGSVLMSEGASGPAVVIARKSPGNLILIRFPLGSAAAASGGTGLRWSFGWSDQIA